jgi:hypothetical protein
MNGKSVENLSVDDIIQAMQQETAMQNLQALADVSHCLNIFKETNRRLPPKWT